MKFKDKISLIIYMIKANYDSYNDTCKCVNCGSITERSNEGFICLKCQIVFNICEDCDVIVLIKGWGDIYYFDEDDNNGPEDKAYDDYYQNTVPDNTKKYFVGPDDNWGDSTKYLWVCPLCKKSEQTCSG